MKQLDIALALVGILVLALAFLSGPIRRVPILSRPTAALIVGVLVGPFGFRLLEPRSWGGAELILEKVALLTIAIGLMAVALRLPARYLTRHSRSLLILLLVVMPLMAIISAGLVWWIAALPFWVAALAGAIVTPTDPIVAGTIVAGDYAEEKLPKHLRYVVSAETGCNDGLAYPLVLLPLLVIENGSSVGTEWMIRALLHGIVGAVVVGWVLGRSVAAALVFAEKREMISRSSLLAYTLALTLLTLGVGELLGVTSILAVFVAGIAFDDTVRSEEREEEEQIQEAVNQFFTVPIFALIGIVIPWSGWIELGWRGVVCALAIVFLRRLPILLIVHRAIPDLRARRDAAFAGWFGPVGIAALYYALRARQQTGIEELWTLTTLIIVTSVVVTGVTGVPLTNRYATNNGDEDDANGRSPAREET